MAPSSLHLTDGVPRSPQPNDLNCLKVRRRGPCRRRPSNWCDNACSGLHVTATRNAQACHPQCVGIALAQFHKLTAENYSEAIRFAQLALDIDPSYAPPAALIAFTRAMEVTQGWGPAQMRRALPKSRTWQDVRSNTARRRGGRAASRVRARRKPVWVGSDRRG
jgi:hypothetical protein